MVNRVQTLRSSVAGARPTGRAPGELYVNFADRELGVVDAGAAAVDLIAVRFFSTLANYVIGQFVWNAGFLYRCIAAVAPGPFNPAQWEQLKMASDPPLGGPYLPLAGGTLTGMLIGPGFTSDGPDGSLRGMAGVTAASNRWLLLLGDNALEGAGNAGSNFQLQRFDNAGALLGAALTIDRSSGATGLNGGLDIRGVFPAGHPLSGYAMGIDAPAGSGAYIRLNSTAAVGQGVALTAFKGGAQRWAMYLADAIAETGGDAGSNFMIQRFGDAGGYIDAPFTIRRSDGVVTVINTLQIQQAGGAWPQLEINGPVSTGKQVVALTNGVPRWNLAVADGGAETGGNVGSNFGISRYNDVGTFLDTPLWLDRASGDANFSHSATFGGTLSAHNQIVLQESAPAAGAYTEFRNNVGAQMGYTGYVGGAMVTVGVGHLNITSTGGMDVTGSPINLNGTTNAQAINCATLSATGTVWSNTTVGSGNRVQAAVDFMCAVAGGNPTYWVNSGGANQGAFYYSATSGEVLMQHMPSSAQLKLDGAGNITAAGGNSSNGNFISSPGHGYQPGGGVWLTFSDARIKTVESEYAYGLDEVCQLRPVNYTYKGNDSQTEAQPSIYARDAQQQRPYVGLIAQEVETVFPGMVQQREGYIDGEKVDDLRSLNASELIYALVNAVKTLAARLDVLEGNPLPRLPSKGMRHA